MFKQSKNWCFTDFELLDWAKIYGASDNIDYICWGKEVCPNTKKNHCQGWIQFSKRLRLSGAKKVCGSKKLHIEACRGSEGENDKYCQKDNAYKTLGKFTVQGERTDLNVLKKMIDEGKNMEDIANKDFRAFISYNRGFQTYKKIVDKRLRKDFRKVKVIHLHGKTGTGKTRRAMEYSKDTYKIQGNQMKWWDGYEGEKTLVIDEYNNDVGITELLGILDGYQLRLPIKGSFTYANWDTVIITSNYRRLNLSAKKLHRMALKRRITETIKVC